MQLSVDDVSFQENTQKIAYLIVTRWITNGGVHLIPIPCNISLYWLRGNLKYKCSDIAQWFYFKLTSSDKT